MFLFFLLSISDFWRVVVVVVIVVDFMADCLTREPRSMGGVPSMVVFLRDPNPSLREFRRKSRKLRAAKSTSAT